MNIPIDEVWHEELLTIRLLNQGDRDKSELKKEIRRIQETKVAPFAPHSDSAYNYWFRALKKRGIIVEHDGVSKLTKLGRWIASSKPGTISERNAFAYLICTKCSSNARLEFVIRTPLVHTLRVNSKGDPFMDVSCPRCGDLSEQYNLGGIANKSEFVDFYNQAVSELGKFVKLEARRI